MLATDIGAREQGAESREQRSRGAEEQRSRGAEGQRRNPKSRISLHPTPHTPHPIHHAPRTTLFQLLTSS
ncbi:hypothetical protein [Scytonema millei]|uniref:Uncharacterized protein n=1 Tax=Scytonema millei VB511283 TaxID=1245923 RepID=A0A9X5E4Q9_9CYAN|nr:hypothetical protein [Scytonema millei]NHC33972.1 hypothetical protein [Scytonema millei VB511283]